MNTTKLIKLFVILEILLLVAYFISSWAMEPHLPTILQEYLTREIESELNKADLILSSIAIPSVLIYMVSIIGMLLTKPWAKNLYAISVFVSLAFMPFAGPIVDHALSAAIYDINSLVVGAILTLLFFTNSAFNKQTNSQKP